MIPLFAIVAIRHPRGGFRIWAPLFLLWIVLAPFALILAPMFLVYAYACRMDGVRALAAVAGVICALGGTHIQVQSPDASVLVRII